MRERSESISGGGNCGNIPPPGVIRCRSLCPASPRRGRRKIGVRFRGLQTCGIGSIMATDTTLKRKLGKVATALDENISGEEMDALLAERREEIEALLDEARRDQERGDEAPLEPLHVFLRQARERFSRR